MALKPESGEKKKNRLSGLTSLFYDALIEDSDGRALGRRSMLVGNYFASVASSMIGGMYFTGLLLKMGATDEFISYINMIISSCTFVQMLSPLLMERFAQRKKLLLSLRMFNYFLNIIFIGAVPFLPVSPVARMSMIMIAVILIYTINALTSPGLSIWHLQSLPHSRRADYYSISSMGSSLILTPINFLTSMLLDSLNGSDVELFNLGAGVFGFYVLRVISIFAALMELRFFLKIKEYPYEKDESTDKPRSLSLLLVPLKNGPFMQMISIILLYNFVGGLIGQYYTIYCLDIVELSYTYLNFCSMVSMPITLLTTPIWAKLIKKLGWLKCLFFGYLVYSLAIFSNAFVTTNTQYVYFIVMVFCAAAGPAVSLTTSNLPYMKMPATNQTAYISTYSTLATLVSLPANFIGVQIFKLTNGHTLNLFGFEMLNYQYVCIFQGILAIGVAFYVMIVRRKFLKDPANADLKL